MVTHWGLILSEVKLANYHFICLVEKKEGTHTDRNILEDSYKLVKHFPDFPLWEYTIASFNQKFLIKGSNSLLPEWEIREMFY